MSKLAKSNFIHIDGINLWAHVGVLDKERLHGQKFLLDITIWIDLNQAAKEDDLLKTADYSHAVICIQQLAQGINCKTIEYFSEQILNSLEDLYGTVPIQIILKKCSPPISGFTGTVSIKRIRNPI